MGFALARNKPNHATNNNNSSKQQQSQPVTFPFNCSHEIKNY